MAGLELAIRAAMTGLGASLLETLLGADRGHRGPRIACAHGHQARFVSYRGKTVDTVLGSIEISRAYYHCPRCHGGLAPRDGELGVTDTSITPGLQAMIDRVAACVPFAKAAGLLAGLAGITVTTKRVERAAEADGATLQERIVAESDAIADGWLTPLPPAVAPKRLYIAVDGTGIPATAAETSGRAGKYPDGRARTREVKLGVIFTQTGLDDKGRPIRDPDSSSYTATLEAAAAFGRLIYAEARRRGSTQAGRLVMLGDGAPWIWNLAALHFPNATEIVDLFHAREHLHDLAALAAPALADNHDDWLKARLTELDTGDIDAITTAARDLPTDKNTAEALDKALNYFHTNRKRMRYAQFRAQGLFVGSGVIEAGCRAVIGQRMKLSGMRWSLPGATGIATLRCHDASNAA